jgi:uncharacterized membrane protein
MKGILDNMSSKKLKGQKLEQVLPYIMIVGGAIGLIASLLLTHDKIKVLQNPGYNPLCNINPILSCGSVMKTEQASLFGMPNTIFGIIAFTALISFGFIMASGAIFKRWLWQVAQVFATVGVLFMHYLFFQGVFRINAICPWCFVTWMVVIPIFWYVTLYNLRTGNIKIGNRDFNKFVQKNHGNILIGWYAIIFLILITRFWYYWSTLL